MPLPCRQSRELHRMGKMSWLSAYSCEISSKESQSHDHQCISIRIERTRSNVDVACSLTLRSTASLSLSACSIGRQKQDASRNDGTSDDGENLAIIRWRIPLSSIVWTYHLGFPTRLHQSTSLCILSHRLQVVSKTRYKATQAEQPKDQSNRNCEMSLHS